MASLGVGFDPLLRICRGCMATGRRMANILLFQHLFTDLTGMIITPVDGFPQWLCYECSALLRKSVRFKHKVMKSHFNLYQHVLGSALVTPTKAEISNLARTNVLCCDIPGNEVEKSEDRNKTASKDTDTHAPAAAILPKIVKVEIKEERVSDYEDNVVEEPSAPPPTPRIIEGPSQLLKKVPVQIGNTKIRPVREIARELENPMECEDIKESITKTIDIPTPATAIVPKIEEVEIKEERVSDYEDNIIEEASVPPPPPSIEGPSQLLKKVPVQIGNTKIRPVRETARVQENQMETSHKPYLNEEFQVPETKSETEDEDSSDHDPENQTKLIEIKVERTNEITIEPVRGAFDDENYAMGDENDAMGDENAEDDEPTDAVDNVFTCDICNKSFVNEHDLIEHACCEVSERPYECKICDKCFVFKAHFDRHNKIHEGVRPYSCHLCDKSFRLLSTLNEHKRTHSSVKTFTCKVCSRSFAQKSCMYRHMHIHTGGRKYECEVCTKTFNHRSSLNKHKIAHSGDKPYICDVCKKCFANKSDLVRHIKRHVDLRPYKCKECNKTFNHRGPLTIHKRIHTGEKPYKCELCGREFSDKGNLNQHLRTHTDDKPFKCDVCLKCFRTKRNLYEHSFLHTGDKPYTCHVCNKGFINERNMNQHVRLHTGEKPFKCELCPKSFIQRIHLKNHIKTHTNASNSSEEKILGTE